MNPNTLSKGELRRTKFTDELIGKSGVSEVTSSPALETLFVIREEADKLDTERAEYFHSVVAMCQYLAKRVRPDTLLPIVFLSSRVSAPDVDDSHKYRTSQGWYY